MTGLLQMLAEPTSPPGHTCHVHHDDDARTEWRRGLNELIPRIDAAARALDAALNTNHAGMLHPDDCIGHLRIAADRITGLCACPCAIDTPGALLAAGASLARARASSVLCGAGAVGASARRRARVEIAQLRSEVLSVVFTSAARSARSEGAALPAPR
jgi:hypothetical protein